MPSGCDNFRPGSIRCLRAKPIGGKTYVLLRPKAVYTRNSSAKSIQAHAFAASSAVTVKASHRLSVAVTAEHDPGCDLLAYLRLPVSQFVLIELPLGGSLQRVGLDLFRITVPRLSFFGIWVQPCITCVVRQMEQPQTVDIRSVQLVIEGSSLVHQMQLTERVDFHVHCQIMAEAGAKPAILSSSDIVALVDPPPHFSFIPPHILESTGSAIVSASLGALHRVFLPSLAADYAKWASSQAYREERAQHAHLSDSNVALS